MVNGAGAFGVVAALFRPGLLVPNVIVPDISHLNWINLKRAGVSHVIFDKDNCITKPLQDSIVPSLEPSWNQCTSVGFATVLIVSNSAGSSNDPLGIGAEHLSRRLGQLVLAHPSKKPANACAKQIVDFLASRNQDNSPGHIMMVGDRITTDIILTSRIQRLLRRRGESSKQAIGVLTTHVHSPESLGTRIMRGIENFILKRLIRMGITPGSSWRSGRNLQTLPTDWQSIATDSQTLSSSPAMEEIVSEEINASSPHSPQLSILQRVREIPTKLTGSVFLAGSRSISWLGAGWHLINDGINLGTKGYIGSPDPALRRTRLHPEANKESRSLFLSPPSTTTPKKSLPFPSSSRSFASRGQVPPPPPPPSPSPFRGSRKGWTGAIAALVLVPTCWYGGVLLHQWVEQHEATEEEEKESSVIDHTTLTPQDSFQQSRANSAPPSLTSLHQQEQAPLTVRHHLQRELQDIDEKLLRLEERMNEKRAGRK